MASFSTTETTSKFSATDKWNKLVEWVKETKDDEDTDIWEFLGDKLGLSSTGKETEVQGVGPGFIEDWIKKGIKEIIQEDWEEFLSPAQAEMWGYKLLSTHPLFPSFILYLQQKQEIDKDEKDDLTDYINVLKKDTEDETDEEYEEEFLKQQHKDMLEAGKDIIAEGKEDACVGYDYYYGDSNEPPIPCIYNGKVEKGKRICEECEGERVCVLADMGVPPKEDYEDLEGPQGVFETDEQYQTRIQFVSRVRGVEVDKLD